MKKALVLGATGGMGSAIVRELQSKGVEVVAFARNKDRLNRMLGMVHNKPARFVGSLSVPREYIYTPDGAKALVQLSFREDSYNQNWNIPGAGLITGHEIVDIAKSILGYNRKVSTVTKNMIRFLGLFDRNMREFVEMYDSLEKPVLLSGEKYEANIGKLPRTPYDEGIRQTIAALKQQ